MRRRIGCGLVVSTLIAGPAPCLAGPPFFTDDPEPVELGHSEFYVLGTLDRADDASAVIGPATKYNRGIAPNTPSAAISACCFPPAAAWRRAAYRRLRRLVLDVGTNG
jgi:hypothetical protein